MPNYIYTANICNSSVTTNVFLIKKKKYYIKKVSVKNGYFKKDQSMWKMGNVTYLFYKLNI